MKVGLVLLSLVLSLPAVAHKPSDSYLTLDLRGPQVQGQWDIALRDLEYAVGLDSNADGAITWGELRASHADIANYALARLQLQAEGQLCELTPDRQWVDQHSDGAYTVLFFRSACSTQADLHLQYQFLFELDPSHRGLLQIRYPSTVRSAVLAPEHAHVALQASQHSNWQQLLDYWREGVWHIWIGFDHILFLLALLLPSVLWRESGCWRHAVSLRRVLVDVTAVVTAFTLAHSLTLGAAMLGGVALPSRWVESLIALTVLLAALNNLWPVITGRRYVLAFGLGLIHGFGFASVLHDLGLPDSALVLALLGFNLGVECGQLAIVAVFLPLAYVLRTSWFYRSAVVELGSVMIALLALVWLAQRAVISA